MVADHAKKLMVATLKKNCLYSHLFNNLNVSLASRAWMHVIALTFPFWQPQKYIHTQYIHTHTYTCIVVLNTYTYTHISIHAYVCIFAYVYIDVNGNQ